MKDRFGRRFALLAATLALAVSLPFGVVLASHAFTDVPTSHKFHADIAAIAAAGITSGCSANRYCPDGLVTRGQMAAFLNRLGALGPGKAPKVNADKVDGIHANGLTRVASMRTTLTTAPLPATPTYTTYGDALSITAPSAGFVVVNGSVSILNSGSSPCTASCSVGGWLGHTGDASSYGYVETTIDPVAVSRGFLGFSVLVPVDAGVNFFDIRLTRFNGTTGALHGWYGSLNAVFSPFASTGGSTTSVAPASLEELTKDIP
jgi:hypothetical protein